MLKKIAIVCSSLLMGQQVFAVTVPGSVPPVRVTTAALYADDTRGIAVPEHEQFRLQANNELLAQASTKSDAGVTFSDADGNLIVASQGNSSMKSQLENIASGDSGYNSPVASAQSNVPVLEFGGPDGFQPEQRNVGAENHTYGFSANIPQSYDSVPDLANMPYDQTAMYDQRGVSNISVTNGYSGEGVMIPTTMQGNWNAQTRQQSEFPISNDFARNSMSNGDGGIEIATTQPNMKRVDMNNSIVKLKEDRVSVRNVVRRMLDQIGGASWDVVWRLSPENASLPDMEISIYTEEPFMNVLNALLARLQTKSGQPLRVVRYDNNQKLVITDQQGRVRTASTKRKTAGIGVDLNGRDTMAVTEQVLKESKVVHHYDEIPLVDALEDMVNQASNGQWRLRVYAGMDQVLKPAHIEEPFNIAMERILALFNLKYEIFPGGKLVVITSGGASGYTNMQQY